MVRQAGFQNVNIDLMSAIPGQTLESWKNTLRRVVMLRPEHISAYSLIIEEGTPFHRRYGDDGAGLPDEDTDREMYHFTKSYLAEKGYERYEVSNYTRPGYACGHNIGYWTGTEYLGVGLGASSYIEDTRFHNCRILREYLTMDMLNPGAGHIVDEQLSIHDKMDEFMILGLRLTKGISGSEFIEKFGQNMWNVYSDVLPELMKEGLLEMDAPYIKLTEFGLDVSNQVFGRFLSR